MNKSRMSVPSNMTLRSTIVLRKVLKTIHTSSLLKPRKGTFGGKGLSRTVIGSTAASEVRSRPLPQSTMIGRKLHSPQRGIALHGTREAAPKTIARTNMTLLQRKLENQVEDDQPVGKVKTSRRLRASIGKQDAARGEANVNSPTQASRSPARPLQPDQDPAVLAEAIIRTSEEEGQEGQAGQERKTTRIRSQDLVGFKGSGGSSRSSPAAVCLVASMLASSVEGLATGNGWPHIACPAKIKVKFETKPNITEYRTTGDLFRYEVEGNNPSKFYPTDFAMSPDPSAIEDSILSANMLAGPVRNELQGFKARRPFLCKSTIGCDHCIPKNLYATPAASEQHVEHYLLSGEAWIADTGSAQGLATKHDVPDRYQFFSDHRMVKAHHTSKAK